MTHFYISCKESRIENNKSFYGSFSLGPFEGGQSLTIANALRRTLLSELKGLAIVEIQIEGVLHEYSSIPGVKDSVLDILLNLKEIHFTSHLPAPKNLAMLPQVGYLRVRGPGVVRSSDLKLPPFIKLVDPDQYIATLAEDGFLNMKFLISEGKNYIIGSNSKFKGVTNKFNSELKMNTSSIKTTKTKTFTVNNSLSFSLRRSLLQKMGLTLDLENQKTISGSVIYNLKKRFLKLKQSQTKKFGYLTDNKINTTMPPKEEHPLNKYPKNLPNSNPLIIDAVFAPVTKVNYMIEYSEHKTIDTSFSNANEINELFNFLKPLASLNTLDNSVNDFDKITTKSYKIENLPSQEFETSQQQYLKSLLSDILIIKNKITSINISKDYVKPSTIKHNVIIEIWTNGSMHPREALYQGLKNLVKTFSSLYKIGSLDLSTNQINNLFNDTNLLSPNLTLLKQKQRLISSSTSNNINKSVTKKSTKSYSSIIPLNKTYFSSNYTLFLAFFGYKA